MLRARANIEERPRRRQARPPSPDGGLTRTTGRIVRLAAVLTAALVLPLTGGCAAGGDAEGPPLPEADAAALVPRQTRELIFAGRRGGEPLAVSLAFRSVEGGNRRAREMRGWLGHGSEWETFLDERWIDGRFGNAWTIVPHGALRIAAGGDGEMETVWYEEGGRKLRLELGRREAEWSRGTTARAQLFHGSLSVGGEATRGTVLELLQLRRPLEDPPAVVEHLLLTSGDSLTLLVSLETPADGGPGNAIAWLRSAAGEREWTVVRLVPRGGRPIPEARREIPRGWELVVPEAGIRGMVWPLGFAAEIGLERAGRRGVEARYTVTGWLELGGRRVRVNGVARHSVN